MSLSLPLKPVYLKACGVTTALGVTSEHSAAAVRAGISAYQESQFYNRNAQLMTMALMPDNMLPSPADALNDRHFLARQTRMLSLAHLALNDLQRNFELSDGLPLMLAGPETLPGCNEACSADFIEQLSLQSEIPFHPEHNGLFTNGRAGGATALQYAMAYIEAGLSEYAVVGGVDSYMDMSLLAKLDDEDRVLADQVLDGFAPGEGAAFFLITRNAECFQDSDKKIMIYPPGLATEKGHRFSEEVYRGDGLSDSFTKALKYSDVTNIQTIMTSLNGENIGAKELGVAVTRNSDRFGDGYVISHPADCFGDVGAAFLPISVGLTAVGFLKNYVASPVLCYASSDGQDRGTFCISEEVS